MQRKRPRQLRCPSGRDHARQWMRYQVRHRMPWRYLQRQWMEWSEGAEKKAEVEEEKEAEKNAEDTVPS